MRVQGAFLLWLPREEDKLLQAVESRKACKPLLLLLSIIAGCSSSCYWLCTSSTATTDTKRSYYDCYYKCTRAKIRQLSPDVLASGHLAIAAQPFIPVRLEDGRNHSHIQAGCPDRDAENAQQRAHAEGNHIG